MPTNFVRSSCSLRPDWCLRCVIVRPADSPPPATDAAYLAKLAQITEPFGITHTGVAPAAVLSRARTAIDDRIRRGLTDGMQFTFRNPSRSTDPQRAVPDAQSVFVAARPSLLDDVPRPGAEGALVAFLHPSAAGGVLVELKQPAVGVGAGRPQAVPLFKAPGRLPRLSKEQKAELEKIVEAGPDLAKDGVVRWRRIDLQKLIKREFAVDYHERHVGILLQQLGFSHVSARPQHPGQDAETIAAFKKTSLIR